MSSLKSWIQHLSISDQTSFYYFLNHPYTLVVMGNIELSLDEKMRSMEEAMSSVSHFNLHLKGKTSIYAKHQVLPLFPNLAYLYMSIEYISLNCWKNLLLSLQCFPKLKNLKVQMGSGGSWNFCYRGPKKISNDMYKSLQL